MRIHNKIYYIIRNKALKKETKDKTSGSKTWTELIKKLKEALRKMNLMIYKQQSGESVIIDADQYNQMILDKKDG